MKPRMRPLADIPPPEVPTLEKPAGDLRIAARSTPVPKLSLPVASAPRPGPRQMGDVGAAPDIRPNGAGEAASVGRLIALSATPAPPEENLSVPSGNLMSRIAISPLGSPPTEPGRAQGAPDASIPNPSAQTDERQPGSGGGPPGIAITGGNPPATSTTSGIGKSGVARSPAAGARPRPEPAAPAPTRTASSPGFETMKPGAAPEQIFGPKRVYTLHVNMPNLASATGSWILSFVELAQEEDLGRAGADNMDLSGPVPLRKVDPRYPPALASAKVQGEVVLYAVIRQDGSVDSIQLVKGVDPQLDTNAMEALARWKFRPAERKGAPVELEAIVHIPFRSVAPAY
jgi:periplasmic protein TonB